jgi:hypothetical protein
MKTNMSPVHQQPRRPRASALGRLIVAAGVATLACLPAVAVAAPSPSPAPALETLLASPPASDYEQNPQPIGIEGKFDLDRYISFLGPKDVNETTSALRREGFITGFSDSWVQEASTHLLVEVVIAFGGKAGAKEWLGKSEQVDKSDSFYKSSIPVSGLETYYGARFADPTRALYADIISFVKGNDYFLVGLVSNADDLKDLASEQTKRQFDKAPPYTIPPAQWPESSGSLAIGPVLVPVPLAIAGASTLALVLLAAFAAVLFVARRQRRPVAAVAAGATAGVPAGALRSDDGYYWWDGESWRLVEQQPVEPPAN